MVFRTRPDFVLMRSRTRSERKAERFRKNQQTGESSGPGVSDPDSTDPEEQPILVAAPGREIESPRSERTLEASERELEPEEVEEP